MKDKRDHRPLRRRLGVVGAIVLLQWTTQMPLVSAAERPRWLAEEMPLPLSVHTPADLEFKAVVERQYLIFNLLAGGKWEWDQGHLAEAATRWDALLHVPNLDPGIGKLVRPLLEQAQKRTSSSPGPAAASSPSRPVLVDDRASEPASAEPGVPAAPGPRPVVVAGSVVGGGTEGPGGAVIWLKRADGNTPRPKPVRHAHLSQLNKTFSPHVLTVTVGSTVTFDNKDPILHDVFSLTKPNDFDSGLFDSSKPYQKVFHSAGAVQVLCNIHASMLGYIVVVDSPWFGQAGRDGRFRIRGVPPGKYQVLAWHESSSTVATSPLTVGESGVEDVQVQVGNDVRPVNLVPDKYGKPRQRQLGY